MDENTIGVGRARGQEACRPRRILGRKNCWVPPVGPAEGSQGRMTNAAGKGIPHHSVDAYGVKESSWAGGIPTHRILWPGGWHSCLYFDSLCTSREKSCLAKPPRKYKDFEAAARLCECEHILSRMLCCSSGDRPGNRQHEPVFVPLKSGREDEEKVKLKNQITRNFAPAGQSWTTAPRFAGNHGSAQADLAWRERMSHEQGMSKAQQLKAKLERAMVGKKPSQTSKTKTPYPGHSSSSQHTRHKTQDIRHKTQDTRHETLDTRY